jgi:hypothetical protein
VTTGNDFIPGHNDRTYRNLVGLKCGLGLSQSGSHEKRIIQQHSCESTQARLANRLWLISNRGMKNFHQVECYI